MSNSLHALEPLASYDEALAFLDGLDVSAMKLGLARIEKLLATLDNPQNRLPMVHIAGTNGKGSVTAMLSAVLKAAGLTVGSFTSPHLIHVRERIAINGNPILPDDLHFEINALKAHLESLEWPREEWPTYFEFLNVMAYQYFRRKGIDITVFETGLGGRMDSTNVVKSPNLTVITSIGMDHMQHLGNTLSAIAGEKAGIIKQGVPLVIGDNIPAEALATIQAKAAQMEAPVTQANDGVLIVSDKSSAANGLVITQADTGQAYRLSLLGPYQKDNLATVLACVAQLRQQGFAISEAAVQSGLSHTYWPVRFQYFHAEHLLLDGSHNEDGFRSLTESMAFYFANEPKLWLVSLRANREPGLLIDVLKACGPILAVVVTQASPTHLYHSPQALAEMLQPHLPAGCPLEIADTPTMAFERLKAMRGQMAEAKPLCVITGSLYTAGEILSRIEKG